MKKLLMIILLLAGITYSQVNPFPVRTFWRDSSNINVPVNYRPFNFGQKVSINGAPLTEEFNVSGDILMHNKIGSDIVLRMQNRDGKVIRGVVSLPYYNDRVVLSGTGWNSDSKESSIIFWDNGQTDIYADSSKPIKFYQNTNEIASFDASGNLAIDGTLNSYPIRQGIALSDTTKFLLLADTTAFNSKTLTTAQLSYKADTSSVLWKDSSGVNVSKNNKRVVITDGLIKRNLYFYDKQGILSSEMYIDTAAHYNTFLGLGTGRNTTTGSSNNFYGYYSGKSNTTGSNNNFYGRSAGELNSTGSYNSFYGHYAGYSNSTGSYNSFYGNAAGSSNTTGTGNNFYGYNSGYSNTTGSYNNFYGYNSGYSNTTGSHNSFYGHYAGRHGSDGWTGNDSTNYSVYVGAYTKSGAIHTSTNTNEIVIGYSAIGAGSNSITLGNTSVTTLITSAKVSQFDSLKFHNEVSMIDSATKIVIATGVAGWGEVMIGDNEEWAHFRFSSSGAVTLITNTTNVSTTPFNPNTLNIYDAGTGIAIQNYLSATQKKVAVNIKYFIP